MRCVSCVVLWVSNAVHSGVLFPLLLCFRLQPHRYLGGKRTDVQCLHRWQKVLRPGLVKGPWTKEEDETIIQCIAQGITKWSEIACRIPGRIGKQCREVRRRPSRDCSVVPRCVA